MLRRCWRGGLPPRVLGWPGVAQAEQRAAALDAVSSSRSIYMGHALVPGLQRSPGTTPARWLTSSTAWAQGRDAAHPSVATKLSDPEYHRRADGSLEHLVDRLDEFLEDNDIDGEVEYSQGVLTLSLAGRGTYVINKQAPNHQIWSSSPVSGPVRYDYVDGWWLYLRDGHELHARLRQELRELTGRDPELEAGGAGD